MKKIIVLLIFLMTTVASHSQIANQEKDVQTTIENLFKGVHKGDTLLLKKTIHKDLKAQTTFTTKKGMPF